ncbi:hypothetical protein [Chryseolinea sp. H1M3-3]|uniref:hypothetical protein n=1 Tax=Chryseolinea sp. H1M3-3 TaxID=3034144 RepID=UPI0023EE115E|nr:hypothetical protein [Chryseolinea sp. H1M3-3]
MKNFPDQDQFNELQHRLESYTEQPDELVWKNIDAALRPNRTPAWLPWIDRFAGGVTVLLFAVLMTGTERVGILEKEKITVAESKTSRQKETKTFPELKIPDGNRDQVSPQQTNVFRSPTNGNQKPLVVDRNLYTKWGNDKQPGGGFADSATRATLKTAKTENFNFETTSNDTLVNSPIALKTDSVVQVNVSENQDPKKIPKRNHTFYITATPMLSFQRAIPISRDGVIVTDISNPSILSTERFAINLDFGIQGYISKRLEYYGGISFYQQSQTLQFKYQSTDGSNVESNGDGNYVVTPKSSKGVVNYDMINLGIQAGALYHLYGKSFAHKFGAGILFQQGLKNKSLEGYDNSGSNYLSYQLFYRNELRLNARTRVFIQPTFIQSIHVREKLKAPFNLKPYKAGIGFGILYNF